MKQLLSKILFRVNIAFVAFLVLSYLAVFISPQYFWPFALLGLLYPFLLIANLVFVAVWAIKLKLQVFLSLVTILFGWNFMARYVQFDVPFVKKKEFHKEAASLKIVSFNVRLFNRYKWLKDKETSQEIFDFINKEAPDIICIQDFFTRPKGTLSESEIMKHLKNANYQHIRYSMSKPNGLNFGIATFSKYPVVGKGEIIFEKSFNLSIYSDLKIGDDTVRVFNNHLQSIRFLKSDYDFVDSLKLAYSQKQMEGMKGITYRLKWAFKMRAMQADEVAAQIRRSPYPVIVCGDFNDSPVSYTYQTMSKNLSDAFVEAGTGLGITYFGKFPSYRIDYILFDKKYKAINFRSPKLELSDHYPVLCRLYKK